MSPARDRLLTRACAWYDEAECSATPTTPQIVTVSTQELMEQVAEAGIDPASVTAGTDATQVRERQSTHARTIVQVSDVRTADYAKGCGYPLEILLDQNPYERSVGDNVSFRVLRDEEPLRNQMVRVGYESPERQRGSFGSRVPVLELRTDDNGRASFVPTTAALWYVAALRLEPSHNKRADYDATWTSVTFRIR